MKLDRIMWGIVLLFIGGVLLLDNFNIIEFYWGNVWRFWPIFLIIAGVNILFNRNKSQIGGIISIAVLVITLGVLFYKGQERREHHSWMNESTRVHEDNMDSDENHHETLDFSHPYTDSVSALTVLNISGGGTSFELKGATDSLIAAHVERKAGNFTLETTKNDTQTTVNFKMKGKSNWNMGDGSNDVDFRLNTNPNWEIHMNMGAGEVDFDLSAYKVRTFNFDGGAAALDIKFGDLLPVTDVHIKTGVAEVKINVPENSGCRIKTKTGLSSKDFEGFIKLADGTFETPNYKTSAKKIFVNLDGGLSSFEVKRY
ncbi:MAG TPA: DUF5668 domain-containing protein [Pedobacter sp.]|uniref:LiaF transmembrane domain-containing protein n=1 Tax=Pedobacter sp. TaxID=1411316 RepID=UPI002BF2F18C|nr:DUF5668 domain-containing protein [Pedobacter sp.]HMI03316.1 DUF5668 domain-containing protein [Pedobacter sp.]